MDYFYVLREGRFLHAGGEEARGLYTDQVRQGDWPMIEQLVAENEGPESLAWLRYWTTEPRCAIGIGGCSIALRLRPARIAMFPRSRP